MSEEIENEVELIEDEVELEEAVQKSADVVHDEETKALMDAEGLGNGEAVEEPQEEVFVEYDRLMSLLESILFASPKPLSFDVIKQIFKGTNIKTKELRRALQEYAVSLANANRGVYLEEVAGGYQIRTKVDNIDFLKNSTKQRPFKVSGPSMETLAIVAYKQPCIKAEVDSIRGVESGHLIRVLMDKGLVQFEGKSDLPGKPMLYKTTKKFLEVFGLRNIRELPSLEEIEQLIPEGIGPQEDKKTLNDLTGELSLDYALRDMEAEEELGKISDKLGEIKTTSDYFEQEKERQRDQRDKDKADDIRERLLMGQYVEDPEMSWLKRYEQKQMERAELAAQAAAALVSTEAATDSSNEVSAEASAMETSNTEEAASSDEVSASESVVPEQSAAEALEANSEESLHEMAAANEATENNEALSESSPESLEASNAESADLASEAANASSTEAPAEVKPTKAEKTEINADNVGQVAQKLTGLAGNAFDAFKAFDEEENPLNEQSDSKNKLDI